MLSRLHDKYGLKAIGLEGAFQSAKPLDAEYFHDAKLTDTDARESVAVRMLSAGEVSSAEFMTMVFSDIKVFGLELASEYNQSPGQGGDPSIRYLLAIAEKTLPAEKAPEINALFARAAQEKSKVKRNEIVSETLEKVLTADTWVKIRYEKLKSSDIQVQSTEAEAAGLRELKAKAEQVGAQVPAESVTAMNETLRFYDTASERSDTMVNRVLNLPGTKRTLPIAMIIGAGHTDKVTRLLREKNVPFSLIRPASLNPKGAGSLTLAQFEKKTGGNWIDDGELSLGRILNTHKKPPPVVELKSAPSFANVNYAAHVIAKAARSGRKLPDDTLRAQLSGLPGVSVDFPSIRQEGYDVIFGATVTDNQGNAKKIWIRAGTATGAAEAKSLEAKLLEENRRLSGDRGGKEPPNDNGKDFADAQDGNGKKGGGVHEGRKGEVGMSHAGIDTLAVFSEDKEKIESHKQLSY